MTPNQKILVLKTLKNSKRLITKGWVQDESAVDKTGDSISAYSPHACKYCMYGAVAASADNVAKSVDPKSASRAKRRTIQLSIDTLSSVVKDTTDYAYCTALHKVINYNDSKHRRKGGVIKAFDRAITKVQTL